MKIPIEASFDRAAFVPASPADRLVDRPRRSLRAAARHDEVPAELPALVIQPAKRAR